MLHDQYTLLQEIGGEYVPYKLKGSDGKMYTPKFNSSDFIPVPKDSTGFSVTPTTRQIEKLNTYDFVRTDPVVRENANKTKPAKTKPTPQPTTEGMTTRSSRTKK